MYKYAYHIVYSAGVIQPVHYDTLIYNVRIASMQPNGTPYGALTGSAVAIQNGMIADIFDSDSLDAVTAQTVIDAQQQWLLPGFIDCHTHLVYGGDRANEFEMRLQGASYKDIAMQGGGIKSTVAKTRAASEETLFKSAVKRANRLAEEGVTTIEVKSGYGLDNDTELRMLRVAKSLERHLPIRIAATYLGAHALPAEFTNNPDAYIEFVCDTVLPNVARHNLADAVDVFCESIGFNIAQTEKVFKTAQQYGLPVKAHVEQLTDSKGAVLAAKYNAISVDHIEYLAENDIHHLATSGSVAVLLPGAFYYLHETQKPPVDALRQHNVPMAVATDLNPGSSPVASLLTAMNMACVLFGLTPEEALRGGTTHAAKALGLADRGEIIPGKLADLTLWDIESPAELVYTLNGHRPTQVFLGGQHV